MEVMDPKGRTLACFGSTPSWGVSVMLRRWLRILYKGLGILQTAATLPGCSSFPLGKVEVLSPLCFSHGRVIGYESRWGSSMNGAAPRKPLSRLFGKVGSLAHGVDSHS
ncbi:hypothetical protein GWK47_031729 [Chionoecetes opilio]|uniref:Uncharacterized protein n=1 Tax=Chionoecetes opilio TaxID=41210 RepID=A0A8J4YK86_CHIOP|nr:hypothetical protein GWK47_031729 [Chionoecetes opilio]